ncbi:MAG: rhomboid family intramembrane serine protease [Candidatus Brocadia sp.]|nr:rhomboid family intramembrane serine protease [Candidatus Brocadia sp.]MCE7910699.1 rhomboid family intramembrane serine protease [Candidatus Brocadia sp. AMX3]MDG5996374.1 rhomboid family intramembrane serine protease [Candidatus Brocadia sp.]RIK01986.1 MAG: rhomboid family intramembrane serine protease [Candidatus Brocadia sp.]UJS19200.1 MAG: rhomboid family intramembrane serine protease [Candidatus Brocadia sp.]
MIPIRDRNPSGTVPVVTASIILTNVLVFLIQLSLGDQLELFLFHFGIVPMKIVYSSEIPDSTFINTYLPFLSYMFLHGGFVHLIGNMWYLWIFGNNIEDQLGHIRFVLFYFICGIGAAIVHVYSNSQSAIPCIGASGAIAGVLGAYMITFPRARILVILPLFVIWEFIELPAIVVLGFWFLIQFFSGTAAISSAQGGGVAWWAHIGGFVLGMIFIKLLPKSRYRHH